MEQYKKLNNQPLIFALAEFRFSPIFQIDQFIPRIQEALRKQYPTPRLKNDQQVQFSPNGMEVRQLTRWVFISADQKSSVEITQDRIVYTTLNYPRFDGFSEACKQVLNIVYDVAEPSLISRIGLRYGDLIKEDNDQLDKLVDKSFLLPGFIENLGINPQRTTETFSTTEHGILAVRSLCGATNVSCLPDIISALAPSAIPDSETSNRVILDFDHYWEARDASVTFNIDEILCRLENLHDCSRKAFWDATTDYARNEKWA